MWPHAYLIFSSILVATTMSQHVMNLKMCVNRETVNLTITSNGAEGGSTCECEVTPYKSPSLQTGYVHTPGAGSHKLHTKPKTWNEARKICLEEGANLAVINNKFEEAAFIEILKKSRHLIKGAFNNDEALLGIHDLYNEGEWVTLFGETIYNNGYYHWSPTYEGGQPDNFGGSQNCGAVVIEGGMDDVVCHEKFAFFCELPVYCTRS